MPIQVINLKELMPNSMEPKIRSLDFNKEENMLLVGTFGCEIYELKAGGEIGSDT